MMTCDQTREWLPWYVTGSIDFEIAERIAAHLKDCDACCAEFVETAQLRHRFGAAVGGAPTPKVSVWSRLRGDSGSEEDVRIDLGSFLIGLRLGIVARDRRTPIHGDLRIWGRSVRIIGKKKGA
jgi:hypothetical protein